MASPTGAVHHRSKTLVGIKKVIWLNVFKLLHTIAVGKLCAWYAKIIMSLSIL